MIVLRSHNWTFLPVTVASFLLIVLGIQESNPLEAEAGGGRTGAKSHFSNPHSRMNAETYKKYYQPKADTNSVFKDAAKPPSEPRWETPQTPSENGQKEADYATVRKEQQQLKELGYYEGSIDGITGPKTAAAIEQFTKDNGLTEAEWNSRKGQTIRQVAIRDSKNLRSLNASSDGTFQVFLIQIASAKDSLYVVHRPDGRVLARGFDASEMIARVAAESGSENGSPSTIYFAVKGGTEDHFNALASTLRILQKTNNDSRRIQALYSAQDLALDPNVFFARGVTLDREPMIAQHGSGYSLTTSVRTQLLVGPKGAAIRIIAKSREILEALKEILHKLFALPTAHDLSVAGIVAHCRTELSKQYDLTEEELQLQIDWEIGAIQVVHIYELFNMTEPKAVYFN